MTEVNRSSANWPGSLPSIIYLPSETTEAESHVGYLGLELFLILVESKLGVGMLTYDLSLSLISVPHLGRTNSSSNHFKLY